MEKRGGIYTITNLRSHNIYIGSAIKFSNRWQLHRRQLNRGTHHSKYLQRAWSKYGADAFEFAPILICAKEHLFFFEQRVINILNPSYNVCQVVNSQLGLKRSDETRAKLSASHVGHAVSQETRAKIIASRKGYKHSAATIAKIRAAHLGQKRSAEACANIRASICGRKHSAETRAKISAIVTGKKYSAEVRANMSAARVLWWRKRKQHIMKEST